MSKKYIVRLSAEEREELQQIIARRSSKSQQVRRAYILLASDVSGEHRYSDSQICSTYSVSIRTIERLRQRCVEEGLQAALQSRKQKPRTERLIDGRVEAHLIALRCSPAPAGYSRWSLRLLADTMVELEYVEHISHEAVRQILKKTRSNRGE